MLMGSEGASKMEESYGRVKARIKEAAEACQRQACDVRLIAVSKYQGIEKIRKLYSLGQKEFAENYGQELEDKAERLQDLAIEWVFIGQLQSNKLKRIVKVAKEIQSVASLKHARLIARYAEEFGKVPYPIFIAVNAGEEKSKGGVACKEASALAALISQDRPALAIQGLMAIPPREFNEWQESVPPLYRKLREMASKVGKGRLSLGMSNDLEKAIAAGSDCVRIGTDLFGERRI